MPGSAVNSQSTRGEETRIEAQRSDGSPVFVTIVILTQDVTEVGVRSGHIGVWDRKVSELVHATIQQKL